MPVLCGCCTFDKPNKRLCVFQVTGLKKGRHTYFFFLEKKYNSMHFERHLAFQNA